MVLSRSLALQCISVSQRKSGTGGGGVVERVLHPALGKIRDNQSSLTKQKLELQLPHLKDCHPHGLKGTPLGVFDVTSKYPASIHAALHKFHNAHRNMHYQRSTIMVPSAAEAAERRRMQDIRGSDASSAKQYPLHEFQLPQHMDSSEKQKREREHTDVTEQFAQRSAGLR